MKADCETERLMIRRFTLNDAEFCSRGYAREAASSVLKDGVITYLLNTVLAVTLPNNFRHI